MKYLLTVVAVVVLAGVWCIQHLSTLALRRERDVYRSARPDLAALRTERERLSRMRTAVAEPVRQEQSEAQTRHQVSAPTGGSVKPMESAFTSGTWVPAQKWKNCGQADPAAAIETMLWAAAGGDVVTLNKVLLLDDTTRRAAEALLARLPATAQRFGGPEQLVAAFTSKAIPIGPARLDLQDCAPDRFNAYLAVKSGDSSPAETISKSTEGPAELQPPRLPDIGPMMIRSLALKRSADGWHIVVPPSAIAKIAQEFSIPP